MKKARILVLTILVVMALFAAVIPALAGDPVMEQIQSFERDRDGDGEPDFWDLRGNVDWYCHHTMMFHGYCGVLFNEAHYTAVAFAGLNEDGFYTNEEGVPDTFEAYVVARDLDDNRAYMGIVIECTDGSLPKIYGAVPGGTYKGAISIPGIIDLDGLNDLFDVCEPVNQRMGMLVLPGYGRILFDAVDFNPPSGL